MAGQKSFGLDRHEYRINFRVKAILVGYKKSPDDNDFHVVIKDLQTSDTMIVEFKDPICSGVCDSPFVTDMQKGRDDFLNSAPVQEKGKQQTSSKSSTNASLSN